MRQYHPELLNRFRVMSKKGLPHPEQDTFYVTTGGLNNFPDGHHGEWSTGYMDDFKQIIYENDMLIVHNEPYSVERGACGFLYLHPERGANRDFAISLDSCTARIIVAGHVKRHALAMKNYYAQLRTDKYLKELAGLMPTLPPGAQKTIKASLSHIKGPAFLPVNQDVIVVVKEIVKRHTQNPA